MVCGYRTKMAAVYLVTALCIAYVGFNFLIYGCTSQVIGSGDKEGIYPRSVSVGHAAEMRDAGAYVLDVRDPWEWEEGRIPGSVLIPLGTLQKRLGELPEDREIVVVCRSGNRSLVGLEILRRAGFEKSSSMDGGITDWTSAGLPVERGEKKSYVP